MSPIDQPAERPIESPATLVIVPTTGGALTIERLAPRRGLPRGVAFAGGDYRPLALAADYARLSAPEGPLAKEVSEPHELRLSAAPDGGRSWEAPVALAHLLLARGHRIVADPAKADLVVWATGAVDLDLAMLPGDYALPLKVEASAPLLRAAAGARVVGVLPPDAEGGAAKAALHALRADAQIMSTPSLREVAERIAGPTPQADANRKARFAERLWLMTNALGVVVLGVALWSALAPDDVSRRNDPPSATSTAPMPPAVVTDRVPADETIAPGEPVPSGTAKPEALPIETVHAVPGSTCKQALFDPARRVRRPVTATDDGAVSTLTPDLCGIALTADGLGDPISEPPGAFVDGGADPSGGRVLFLRGAPRNTLYTVPYRDRGRDGDKERSLRHALRLPDKTR